MADLDNAIAIVGMAGRFPGARGVAALWRNLRDGVESVTFFDEDELIEAGVDPALVADPRYVKAAARLEDPELFDAGFFELTPREAELTDPQHRVFLECAWEALEDAGHDPGRFAGSIGVFAGAGKSHYLVHHLLANPAVVEAMGPVATTVATEKDFVATRVAYALDLRGPCVSVQTACSTSLVAVHLAAQSLLACECDMALAGGVSISALRKEGYLHVEDGIFSPDGHLRAFDARAAGQIGGNGAAVVVLRRLADALEAGDTVRAVLLGSALNNDGRGKVSFGAPGVEGQARVIAEALEVAGVHPDTIGYVECHGTGTHLGDPIEVAALTQAWRERTRARGTCALGSLKTNIGHLDAAAGAAGLIKAVLALEHEALPPSLHFEEPNPELHLDTSPFFVNAALSEWKRGERPRRAGVSSFGIGGTNVHAIVEEAPAEAVRHASDRHQLIVLSARSPAALDQAAERLARHLERHGELALADVACTTQLGRRAFAERRAVVCRDRADAIAALRARDTRTVEGSSAAGDAPPVAFLFSGQGAQYPNMTRGLYERLPAYRAELDRVCDALAPHVGRDLRELLFPDPDGPGQEEAAAGELRDTRFTQPALFAVEVALARLWMGWGVEPDAMLGHSIGELVAAHLAGVLALEDAARLVAARGRAIGELPAGGGMLAVHLAEAELAEILPPELSLAAVNAPGLCVASGPLEALGRLEEDLAAREIATRRLHTSHAFHSALMEPALAPFAGEAARARFAAPTSRYVSCATGTWVRDEDARDPRAWVRQLREPVRFADGVRTLVDGGARVLLEVGPGESLTTLARLGVSADEDVTVVASTRPPGKKDADDEAELLRALGRLWTAGVEVDWARVHAGERRRRVPLPTYPFQRERYWIERPPDGAPQRDGAPRRRSDPADWFYVPSWKRAAWGATREVAGERWLVLADEGELAADLAARLEGAGGQVVVCRAGGGFARRGARDFELAPGDPEGYRSLLASLRDEQALPDAIVLLWGCDPIADPDGNVERCFYAPLFLAQALAESDVRPQLEIVTVGAEDVLGEPVVAEKATVLGPCKAAAAELPGVACRWIDLAPGEDLFAELCAEPLGTRVALRGGQRWVPDVAPVRLEPRRPACLRENAVVLVTGGLGGVGLTLAEHLARTAQARLVLVGRTGLPEPEHDGGEQDERTRARLAAVHRLEELGAEVLVAAADVADAGAMSAVVARAKARFGAIHGVIHAAGLPGDGLLALKTRDRAEAVLAPKVRGTRVLAEVLRGEPLDFVCLCSSLATALDGVGQVDYFAANAFLDAFAHDAHRPETRVVTIGWDAWREVGMAVATDVPEALRAGREESLRLGLAPAEGAEVFDRALASRHPHLFVSTRDLARRIEAAAAGPVEEPRAADVTPEVGSSTGRKHERPRVSSEYVEPRNRTEHAIAETWAELLGIDRVGVHDDFFELGGNSLLMMQISMRLRSHHGVALSMRTLFETPDVASMAERVDALNLMSGVERNGEPEAVETEEFKL